MAFSIGYAQTVITPSLKKTVYLAGFGQNRKAQSIHDDLYLRVLALQSDSVLVALAAADLIGLSRFHCTEIEKRVQDQAPGVRLILACTHTHHGPDTLGLWGPDMSTCGVDADYIEEVKGKCVQVVLAALKSMRPATMNATSIQVKGVAKNARNPEIVDDRLTCLQFRDPFRHTILASLMNFPCHPEVLWEHNPHITSDYPGYLRREVEAMTQAPCLFFSGALGGMMTPDVQDHSFAEAEAMGTKLAQEGLKALSNAHTVPVAISLRHNCAQFSIPMTNPMFQMAMQAGLLPNLVNEHGEIVTETNIIKIGPVWLAAVPGELLPALGLALKEELRKAGAAVCGVIGLANDELGYILPQEDFVYPENPFQPGNHYEETMSIGPEAGPRLMQALRHLLSANI
jgi:hypothetical protein